MSSNTKIEARQVNISFFNNLKNLNYFHYRNREKKNHLVDQDQKIVQEQKVREGK
jgi:hypothetical protein